MSYAVPSLEAIREALGILSSPNGLRVLEAADLVAQELDAALGPAPLVIRIRTSGGPVSLAFGEEVAA